MLTACGVGDSDPSHFSSLSEAKSWIKKAGYECTDWKENSKTHAVCRTSGGGSITISIDDDPMSAVDWYFSGPEWVNMTVGDNWFSPCMASEMRKCADLASVTGVKLIPNPIYIDS